MKKVLLLAAFVLGTTAMVNAQSEPANAPAKEVKTSKHARHHAKKAMKAAKAETANEKK